MLSQAQIEKSYLSLSQGREPLPVSKEIVPSEWKVRFQYIELQPYCPYCKKWDHDTSYDYCSQCGSDYYSHIDVKDGEIAPVRRGWCFLCRINLSLNEQFKCEACFYEGIGNKAKANQINALRLKAKTEVEGGEVYQETQRIKKSAPKYVYDFLVFFAADRLLRPSNKK